MWLRNLHKQVYWKNQDFRPKKNGVRNDMILIMRRESKYFYVILENTAITQWH